MDSNEHFEVKLPRSAPLPSEFDVDMANYSDGYAEVAQPDWLEDAAKERAWARGEIAIGGVQPSYRKTQRKNRHTNYTWALRQYGGNPQAGE